MDECDDVKAVIDGVAIAEFLVPAVALVFRGAKNGDLERRMRLLVAQAIEKSLISRKVVDDRDLDTLLVKRGGNAAEHLLDRCLGVVSNDEDQHAVATQIERWSEAHASFLKLKAGHPLGGSKCFLGAVSARRVGLAEHGIGCGEKSCVVVVAKAT